jgi:hypothetical protein
MKGELGTYDFTGRIWVHMPSYVFVPGTSYNYPFVIILTGSGDILLNEEDATEKFGCFGNSMLSGFQQCEFREKLNIWTSYSGTNIGGDVFINSTIGSPGKFTLDIQRSEGMNECSPPNSRCEVIYLGETAKFDANITNDLGTGSTFTLSVHSYYHIDKDGVNKSEDGTLGCIKPCMDNFNPNGDDFNVADGDTNTSILSLTPTERGTYKIYVRANKPDGYDSQLNLITLRVVDFDVYFLPPENVTVKKNEIGNFNIEIYNHVEERKNFTLTYSCTGGCTCFNVSNQPFDGTVLTVDGDSPGFTTISCSSPNLGQHIIRVEARTDDIIRRTVDCGEPCIKSVTLKVQKCNGNISLSISTSYPVPPNTVYQGTEFRATASNLADCSGEKVDFAINDPTNKIGSCIITTGNDRCSKDFTADTADYSLGDHNFYALIEKTGDGDYTDTGENDTKVLTVKYIGPCGCQKGGNYYLASCEDPCLGNNLYVWCRDDFGVYDVVTTLMQNGSHAICQYSSCSGGVCTGAQLWHGLFNINYFDKYNTYILCRGDADCPDGESYCLEQTQDDKIYFFCHSILGPQGCNEVSDTCFTHNLGIGGGDKCPSSQTGCDPSVWSCIQGNYTKCLKECDTDSCS